MTSAAHTRILIAVSLLQGEEIGYLKASFSPAHFLPPLLLTFLYCMSSFFSSCLITVLAFVWFSLLHFSLLPCGHRVFYQGMQDGRKGRDTQ